MISTKLRGVLAAAAVLGVFASGFAAATTFFSGSISSSSLPNMDNRLTRDGNPSTCGGAKSFPGVQGGANFAYQEIPYTNQGPARCVTFTMQANCSGGGNPFGSFLSGYSGAFDPANLATNYAGDAGISTGISDPTSMQLNLAAGQSISLVIMQVNDDTTNPPQVCNYFMDDNITRPVPTMSEAGLLITALSLCGLGFAFLRRRSSRA